MILGNDVCALSPPPNVLPVPQKGVPLIELPQRKMLPFQNPPTVCKIPSQRTPQVPQWAPAERDTHLQTFPSKSPVNEPPSTFSNRVPVDREASSPETMVYLFIYIGQSPP